MRLLFAAIICCIASQAFAVPQRHLPFKAKPGDACVMSSRNKDICVKSKYIDPAHIKKTKKKPHKSHS